VHALALVTVRVPFFMPVEPELTRPGVEVVLAFRVARHRPDQVWERVMELGADRPRSLPARPGVTVEGTGDFHADLFHDLIDGVTEVQDVSGAEVRAFTTLRLGEEVPMEPYIVTRTRPELPAAARELGLRGTVVVGAYVDRYGRCRRTTVVSSSGHTVLDRAAAAAVRDWTFRAPRRGGAPQAGYTQVPVVFSAR
jgi:TonB family protein